MSRHFGCFPKDQELEEVVKPLDITEPILERTRMKLDEEEDKNKDLPVPLDEYFDQTNARENQLQTIRMTSTYITRRVRVERKQLVQHCNVIMKRQEGRESAKSCFAERCDTLTDLSQSKPVNQLQEFLSSP